jgi:hypothetical protein
MLTVGPVGHSESIRGQTAAHVLELKGPQQAIIALAPENE